MMKINKEKAINIVKESALIALSFIIPLVILIILCSINKLSLTSYSNKTMMMIDMSSEYIAYMSDFRNLLLGNGNFIYTTRKVFGGDFLSIYTFYLASPFNLFVVFFEQEAIPLFFLWSSIIKMSFAGLNMYLLARLTSKFNYQKLIVSIGYALISYSFIYMSNYMWLDGVMILPLVILGLHYLKDKKHLWLYPLGIAYSLLTSWYIGFMICIFVVLYFLVLFFKDFSRKNKENNIFLLRFVVFSLLGGLIAAPFWVTAFIHLEGTKGTAYLPENNFFSLSMILSGFMENNYNDTSMITQYRDYISMFVGVVPLVFALTFFVNKEYRLRERLLYLGVVLFYLICSWNSILTALLHGGREPTWFPGRYSFIIGFIVCYLASKSLDSAEKLNPLGYLLPLGVGLFSIIIVSTVRHSDRLELYHLSIPSVIMYFVTILVGTIYSYVNTSKKLQGKTFDLIKKYSFILLSSLVIVQIASSYRGGDKVIKENLKSNQYTSYQTYLNDVKYIEPFNNIKTYEKEHDNSAFYRMEATFNRPGNYNDINNNPFFYSYAGLSNFSSSSKKDIEGYSSKIGFHYNWFWVSYDGGSTYAINSLLGIKYLLEDKNSDENIHPYFLDKGAFEKLNLEDTTVDYYYNSHATSIAFLSDKTSSYYINEGNSTADGKVNWFDKFEYQNQMFKSFDNSINKDIFNPLEIYSFNTSIQFEEDEFGHVRYKNVKAGNTVEIRFRVPLEGYNFPLYFSEKDYVDYVNYYIDGERYEVNNYWHKGIYSFPDNNSHDHVLRLVFQKDFDEVKLIPELYYENLNTSYEYLDAINKYQVKVNKELSSLTKGGFSGTINLNEKVNKDLIFTIPYEKEIHVTVDGKNVETYKKCNIFTAIDLSSLDVGEHKISIYYQDAGLLAGYVLMAFSIVALVPLIIFYDKVEGFLFYRKRKEEIKE